MKKSITCYLISEANLGLQCAIELIKEGHQLLGVISTHHETCRWAEQNNIPTIPSLLDFQALNPYKKFDYLFSIINTKILSSSVLRLPVFSAINYHDSPLPKYAGVHATSWALLSNEKNHAVTWHKMEEIVDKGFILKQTIFPIREDETALSLNLECYIRGLESFKDLIKDLAQDNTSLGIEQDIKNRSYFARHQKPSNLGFISWSSSAKDIERQFRALYFGDYPNTFATFKVLIGDQIFIPTELKILNTQSEDIAGTVINITDKKIQISTETQDIALTSFKTVKGQPVTISEIKRSSCLNSGYKLQNLNTKLTKELHKLYSDLSPCEMFWTRSIINSSPPILPFMHQLIKIDEVKAKNKKYKKTIIPNEKFLLYSSHHYHNTKKSNYSFEEVILAAFVIYLNRIGNILPFSLGFLNSFLQGLPRSLQSFFPKYVPLTFSVLPNMMISDLMSHIQNQLIAAEKNKAYFNDLIARSPNLDSSFAELPIVIKIEEEFRTENAKKKEKKEKGFDSTTLIFNIDKKNKVCVLEIEEFLIEDCLCDAVIALINDLPEHLEMLIKQIIENPYKTIDKLSLLTSEKEHQLLIEWNNTDKDYPDNKTIHQLFEEQAERTPDNIALVYEETKLTYKEVNEKANQLGHYLRTLGVKSDTLVGIAVERSLMMIIGLLGILKAGGAYMPLDSSCPVERMQFMLDDAQVPIILTDRNTNDKIPTTFAQVISLDEEWGVINNCPSDNITSSTVSNNLAYIIYTSGTTGNPKGVMIEHGGVVNYIDNIKLHTLMSSKDRVDFSTNIGFDLTVTTTICSLCLGSQVIIYGNQLQDLESYKDHLIKNDVSMIKLVPSYFELLIDFLAATKINKVILGGEKLSSSIIEKLSKLPNDIKSRFDLIIDEYGPTESTVGIYGNQVYLDKKSTKGRLYYNSKAYVLDSVLMPLPIGAIGELYIGGVGLARGYLNQPSLTAEKFILNPFQTTEEKNDKSFSKEGKNARLYKTGDLVRWLPDGNLEYIGRNDFQVKIRGYRIELEEIESSLSSYIGIKQSIVLAKEHINSEGEPIGNKYLVGYYVSEDKLDEENILNYLKSKLPDYMIPSFIVHLDKLPLTINGKLDRRALPDPEFTNSDSYKAPRNELEAKVCRIWSEVLGLTEDKVGIRDDFFSLGGNSILAIKLVSKLNKELDSNISVSAIFKHNTIERLAHYFEHNTEDNIVIEKATVTKLEEQSLSFAQERLWFIEKYEEGSNAYNIPMVFKLSAAIELDILDKSIKSIVSRHEILRTLIREDSEGNGYQLVRDIEEYPLEIRKINIADQAALDHELSKELNHVYDLSNEYLIRVCFYEMINANTKFNTDTSRYLSIVIHHIAFDGWSVDIFFRELEEYYNYYKDQAQGVEASLNLPSLTIQYKDFAIWQRSYLSGERLDNQINYWKGKLESYETLNLITDKPRQNKIDYAGNDIYFELDEDTSKQLREIAKELKVSLYSLLLSGYYLMLRSYSNQDNIVIGTPIANRHYSQIENLLGFFVNSLALRVEIDPKASIKEFIQSIGREVVEAHLHQDLPFEKLTEELKVAKDTSRHPIFQVMFGVQNFGTEFYNQTNNIANLLQPYTTTTSLYNIAKFDISTFIDDSQIKLRGSFNYAVSLYNEETISGFIETYTEILKQLGRLANNNERQEQTKIEDLSYLNQGQYNQIIYTWNQTEKVYPDNKTIHQLFEEQVENTPNNIAVVYERTKLTYKELNNRANQLANYLRQIHNIKPDTLIALCLDRSEHMLIAILATLKTGAAYVPMDPSYPDDRINYILEDTKAILVLANEDQEQRLKRLSSIGKINILAIDNEKVQEGLSLQPISNPKTDTTSTSLAYVIYTSGTTGNPKGVMIEHKGCIIRILYMIMANDIADKDYFLFTINYIFDASFANIFSTIISGSTLYITRETLDINEIKNILETTDINICHFVPSQFDVIKQECNFSKLKRLIFSGEALGLHTLSHLSKDKVILNYYGPTEVGEVTLNKFNVSNCKSSLNNSYSVIGKPFDQTTLYVVNNNLIPLPIGAIGELYIGGIGLARGYLNQLDLTAERFINNPFQTEEENRLGKNARLYKTGDLVRWLPDGNLEYIGRNDFQVKIRGYRIELGEIENALSSYEGINQCVALVKERLGKDGTSTDNKYLIAYYISDRKLDEARVLDYLQNLLPEYMLPNILMHLDSLPLTINGKLDRKALPDPEFTNSDSYKAPRNELEAKVCRIWSEVLGLTEDKLGIRDDFFRLGGNSILAIKLVNILNNYYKSYLKISDIFVYKNIELLLPRIVQTKDSYQTIVKLNNSYAKANMFMIHPGAGGCEVYTSLADALVDNFSCYGIDSYNLYNENKIDNLNELAKYYLSHIDEVMLNTHQEVYHLLGWSLGGQISLEIACILEQRGRIKIKVYLLDSILMDDYLLSLTNKVNVEKLKNEYRDYAISQGYNKSYIQKAISNLDVELSLNKQKTSLILTNTQVLLFKAMLEDTRFKMDNSKENYEYLSTLKYNNIDSIIENKSKIKLIEINDAHHGNILDQKELLVSKIRELQRFKYGGMDCL